MGTPDMNKAIKLSAFAIIAAAGLAGVVQAQELRVSILGKTPPQVHAAIAHAARKVCRDEADVSLTGEASPRAQCITDTIAKAEGEYRRKAAMQVAMANGG
jgi:hypothetical protein